MKSKETLSNKTFLELARFIQGKYGIKMPASKKVMLESRIRRRMRQIGYNCIDEYLKYVFSGAGKKHELINMVDFITTNKTDFFREPAHFDILATKAIPQIISSQLFSSSCTLNVWSSACSSGEEAYTLAMVLSEVAEKNERFKFNILASDLSTRVLKKACQGIYSEELIDDIPMTFREKYLLKSKNRALQLVQIQKHLRKRVTFRRINLMAEDFGIKDKMHIIFCRNVLIYFQKEEQQRLMVKFARQLEPGGFLFIGHSESLSGMDVPFCQVVPTIYKKNDSTSGT